MRAPFHLYRRSALASGQPPERGELLAVLGLSPNADARLIEIAYRCALESLAVDAGGTVSADRRRRLDDAVMALRAVDAGCGGPSSSRIDRDTIDPYELLRLHRSAGQALVAAAYAHALRPALVDGDGDRIAALEWAYSRIGTAAARSEHDMEPPPKRHRARQAPAVPAAPGTAAKPPPEGLSRPRRIFNALTGRTLHSAAPRSEAAVNTGDGPAVPVVARPVRALSIALGGETVETVELKDGAAYILGSAVHCDIPLVPPVLESAGAIASEHARIAAGVGGVSFRQIADHAETLVNGAPARWRLLEPGDELRIGPYRCRYTIARYDVDRWRVAAWS